MGRYWLVLVYIGSVRGGTVWFLVILGQYGAVLVALGQKKAVMVSAWWY